MDEQNKDLRIVVLDRGWIFIGEFSEDGMECTLKDAYVIRRWGTTKGLGELAIEGKKPETVLDKAGIIHYHKNAQVMNLRCDLSKWKEYE